MFTIYGLYHHDTLLYVGCTKRPLSARMANHFTQSSGNRLVREYLDNHGRDKNNYSMQTLDTCRLGCPEASRDIEKSYVQWLNPPCNCNNHGGKGWVKGKKFTPEHRQKMSYSRKGRKFTSEHCAKISAGQSGSKNHRHGKPAHNRHPAWKHADEIVRLFNTGEWTQKELGRKFGCSRDPIRNIIKSAG